MAYTYTWTWSSDSKLTCIEISIQLCSIKSDVSKCMTYKCMVMVEIINNVLFYENHNNYN